MSHDKNLNLSEEVIVLATQRSIMIATAESCTGGLIAATLTEIPGASAVIDRGFVTYSNEAKAEMLGVPLTLIEQHGAVSAEVAQAMAAGALQHSRASLTVSVTGVAGPTGGTAEKPVGLVYFGIARTGAAPFTEQRQFKDKGRDFIRSKTVRTALKLLVEHLNS